MYKLRDIFVGYLNLVLIKLNLKDNEEYKRRMSICFVCRHRRGVSCGICGCLLHAKVSCSYCWCPHPKNDKWRE
jgi:hypothetical protein